MKKQQFYVTMRDNHKIFVRTYEPAHIVGHIHILHGMAEHSARYDEFARYLCEAGYYVSMHDHRGHGESAAGKLGYFADERGFHMIVLDVLEVLYNVRQKVTAPLVLFGHSMGSFVARRFIQLYSDEIRACIICGTGDSTSKDVAGHQAARLLTKLNGKETPSQLMNDLSFGNFNATFDDVQTAFDWLTRDRAEVQKYMEDEWCGFIPSHQFFVDLTEGIALASNKKEMATMRKDLPILLISGTDDPVGNFGKGVFRVAEKMADVGMENVKVHLFEGLRHEILNEVKKELVYEAILWWLQHDQK